MFNPKTVQELVVSYHQVFKSLYHIEKILKERFADMDHIIEALILSAASGEPLLLIGPPGTGKSRLIRAFCGMIGLLDEDNPSKGHPDYFEYLLTPFTEPGELFGFYDIKSATEGKQLKRYDEGMMQHARVVYLDEVFNGSSAILNSLLSFLNERVFHDRNVRKEVKMECLFAATNNVPETPELRAMFDRFLLRCHVDNMPSNPLKITTLLEKGWYVTYSRHQGDGNFRKLLDDLRDFREKIKDYNDQKELMIKGTNKQFPTALTQLVSHARQYDLSQMSNRRLVKMLHVMLTHRVYHASCQEEHQKKEEILLGPGQLELLPRYFLDRYDEEAVRQMVTAANEELI